MIPILALLLLIPAAAGAFYAKHLPLQVRPFLVPLPALISCLLVAVGMGAIATGAEAWQLRADWVPQLGVEFGFTLTSLGWMLFVVVTGIGTLVLLYATGYMGEKPMANRLFGYLYLFMFSMAGLALSDHLLLLFIFWELTSITSYLLIGFDHTKAEARKSALQALLVTGLGGMALLAGAILLYIAGGSWYISDLASQHEAIIAHPLYPGILALVLLGAFTKSAQYPFHFWLPNAMSAPTPVSAYLHSATMVKAGVFLLALMLPIIGGTSAWTVTLGIFGGITFIVGSIFSFRHHDLKKLLAGTTVAVLGALTMLLGLGTKTAVLAAMVYFVAHALYKAALFMAAGSIDHETGTRDARLLGGLRKAMPWTAAAALLAAISKMGLPPFVGFIAKEYAYKAGLDAGMAWLVTGATVLGSVLLVALAIKTGIQPFWAKAERPGELPKHPHEAPWSMWLGPLLLASMGLLAGALITVFNPFFSSVTAVALGKPAEADLALWHGFNLPLLLSVVTIALGLLAARYGRALHHFLVKTALPPAERGYHACLNGMTAFAVAQTRFLQSGYLRNYLLIILASTCILVLMKLWEFGAPPLAIPITASANDWVVTGLMIAATAMACTTRSRITALVSLGVVGFGMSWIFALYSAPDLAITQILVETLIVVLFAWVVHELPAHRTHSKPRTLIFDLVVASLSGLLITVLVLKSLATHLGPKISDQLVQWSLPEAYGSNVVNVILVDFRALDTLGEITVLAIAALGVAALLRLRRQPSQT